MGWIDRGVVECFPGINRDLVSVSRANFRMAVRLRDEPIGAVEYWGVLRHLQFLSGVTPSIDAEIVVKPVWHNATEWRLTNSAAGGRIAFYVPETRSQSLFIRTYEFVP